jgi:predicted DNA-binding transcriptional regulator AlpA
MKTHTPVFGKAKAPTLASAAAPPALRLLDDKALVAKGIYYSRNYLRRLWQEGKFPKPIHLSPRRIAWREAHVDRWIEQKMQEQRR